MAGVKMPFGKYRGKRLISIDSEYLTYVLQGEEVDADLRRAILYELDRRGETPPEESEVKPEEKPKKKMDVKKPEVEVTHVSPMGQRLAGDVRVIFRNLALQYHPDRGGTAEAMKALNELHDQVQELLNHTFSAT